MNYKYNAKKVILREEKKGMYLLIGEEAQYNFVINETGKEIYDILDKYNKTEDIVHEMKCKYNKIDVEIIEKDVYEILKCFEIYNLIELEDDNFCETNDIRCFFNGDIYYKKVNKFIISELAKKDSVKICINNKTYYDVMLMRMRQMQNKEYQLIVQDKNGIGAYASISCNPVNVSKVLIINEIIFRDGLTENEIIEYFKMIMKKVFFLFSKYIILSKIRLACSSYNYNIRAVEIFKKQGFEETVHLKNETTNGDLYFFDYEIRGEKVLCNNDC